MKVIHKISPVLILLGYFYILYEGYFLCQFGGVRYHGQKMAVGAAVMAVGFLFWLITRKKAKEQQAGKKTEKKVTAPKTEKPESGKAA